MTNIFAAITLFRRFQRRGVPGTITDGEIAGVPAAVCRPSGRQGGRPVIVLHGVTPEAERDPRLLRLLDGLAAVGLTAWAPRMECMATGLVCREDVEVIVRAVLELYRETGRRPALMAFSVGGAYALLAAGQPEAAGRISLVCSVGGYADVRALVSGFFDPRAGDEEQWSRLVAFYSFSASARLPGADLQVMGRMAGLPHSADRTREMASMSGELSPEGQRCFGSLVKGEPWVLEAIMQDLAATGQVSAMSPISHLEYVTCPVYLLHGRGDRVISWRQTAAIAERLTALGKPPARFRISEGFDHVAPRRLGSLWLDLLFFAAVIREAKR